MALPTNVGYGKVVAQWLLAVGDTNDAGSLPDGLPAKGKVTFIPSVPKVLNASATPNPVTIYLQPIECTLDDEGYLVDPQKARGVWLVATDDTQNNPAGWTYTVKVAITGVPPQEFSISVPEGGTVDLTLATPVPSANGVYYVAGPPGPTGAAATDGDVATYVGTPTSATALALSATLGPGGTAGNVALAQVGATVGASSLNPDGSIALTVSTPWGIRANGTPYYDPAGAAPGEKAALDINPDTGAPRLTLIGA